MMRDEHLQTLSRRVYRMGVGVGIMSTAIALLRWFVLTDPNVLPPTIATHISAGKLTIVHRVAGLIVELIPLSPALYALTTLSNICGDYGRGMLFCATTGNRFRSLGISIVLLGCANGLYTTLIIGIFSLLDTNRVTLAFGLSTSDLYLIVVGCAIAMLGVVMDRAFQIHEENSQII